ncbi:hypothetical protein C9374_002561 [Naegleria lovaniensis]|uniref:Uncharacterized protein n=1 Tax=Naegleria lovaniensis TaxID=51637 RepID=A0AA88GSM3_NAELO|nr:uncharacterized protein C9374_002561 [Naegleria lovaniensis]KAG2386115.1 hypothetical protein C9374_002561 [Naegleria lovaniensis]
MPRFVREKKFFTVRVGQKILQNVPKDTNLMDLLVKNKINFAYPFKFFLFPLLAKGIIKYTKLPKFQSTVACGTLTGKYKHLPFLNCSQCLVAVKYDKQSVHNKESTMDKVYRSNVFLQRFAPKDSFVRYACRTKIDDDMEVMTYCDDTKSRSWIGITLMMFFAFSAVAVVYSWFAHIRNLQISTALTKRKEDESSEQSPITDKDLEEWMKKVSDTKTEITSPSNAAITTHEIKPTTEKP